MKILTCTKCGNILHEDDLVFMEDKKTFDNIEKRFEWMNACPHCKTDAYLKQD